MYKRFIKGAVLFFLGVAVGILSQHITNFIPFHNQVGMQLQIDGVDLPYFSLREDDRAIVVTLSSDTNDLNEQISFLQHVVLKSENIHFLLVWDREIPDGLPLEYLINSYKCNSGGYNSYPCYYVVDTRYNILHKTNRYSELVNNIEGWLSEP